MANAKKKANPLLTGLVSDIASMMHTIKEIQGAIRAMNAEMDALKLAQRDMAERQAVHMEVMEQGGIRSAPSYIPWVLHHPHESVHDLYRVIRGTQSVTLPHGTSLAQARGVTEAMNKG